MKNPNPIDHPLAPESAVFAMEMAITDLPHPEANPNSCRDAANAVYYRLAAIPLDKFVENMAYVVDHLDQGQGDPAAPIAVKAMAEEMLPLWRSIRAGMKPEQVELAETLFIMRSHLEQIKEGYLFDGPAAEASHE